MTNLSVNTAATILRQGGLVAFPTETVYGLGADARNDTALRKIFAAKERPYNHPLIVHLAEVDQLQEWAIDISPHAMKLASHFWPGPLTLILKKRNTVSKTVTGGQSTIGLRIPHHPIAQALLRAFGGGIAAPSANKFTRVSPTTAQAVQEELGEKVDLILDGGACELGLESTIIDMSGEHPILLRPGMMNTQMIEAVLSMKIYLSAKKNAEVRAPGMHHLHYAPATKTFLIATDQLNTFLQTLQFNDLPIAVMTYSGWDNPAIKNIYLEQMPHTAKHYAHHLYHTLRSLDHKQFKCIVIESVPLQSEWDAIRDRLLKATFKD